MHRRVWGLRVDSAAAAAAAAEKMRADKHDLMGDGVVPGLGTVAPGLVASGAGLVARVTWGS